jgi:hypothetical protein
MNHFGRIKAAIAAVTVIGAATAAMLIPAAPAVAFSSGGLVLDIKVQTPGQLIARGAAVGVPVEYTCFGESFAQLFINVTERVSGGAIASGSADLLNPVCTGEIQSATLDVTASSARAFAKGTALVSAEIIGCANFCGTQTDDRTITIK